MRSGDRLVVWRLDRLGRTLKGLVEFVADLQQQALQFRGLTDGIDTTAGNGRGIALGDLEGIRDRITARGGGARNRLSGWSFGIPR
jgi:DNA invertase Pin-like site-specific DNA recombinase